ncbi:MAG: glycosyltransferase [Chthoniobacterales bacterium]
MSKRILQVFNRYRERGGEEKSAQRIFEHASLDFSVERLWWDSRDWDAPSGPGKLGQLRRLFCNPDTCREFREKVEAFRPDVAVFHNIYPVGSPGLYREVRQLGVPVIQFIHNFRPFSVVGSLWTGERIEEESLRRNYRAEVLAGTWQNSRLKSALFALLLKRLHASGDLDVVKRWVAISEFMREKFIEAGVPAERVVTLRHSWDARPAAGETGEGDYYLFLSRLIPEKGVQTVLDAWQRLGERAPRLIIGGTGAMEAAVKKVAIQSDKIEYAGFVDGEKKAGLIAGCRAMLAPSIWWEPLGLVTYEAYDFGKPMIAAASGGLKETVIDCETGLLFEAGNVDSLISAVQAMEKLSREERATMGAKGREWLLREADPAAWRKSFCSIVADVVEERAES